MKDATAASPVTVQLIELSQFKCMSCVCDREAEENLVSSRLRRIRVRPVAMPNTTVSG